jgi:hypothetical protein
MGKCKNNTAKKIGPIEAIETLKPELSLIISNPVIENPVNPIENDDSGFQPLENKVDANPVILTLAEMVKATMADDHEKTLAELTAIVDHAEFIALPFNKRMKIKRAQQKAGNDADKLAEKTRKETEKGNKVGAGKITNTYSWVNAITDAIKNSNFSVKSNLSTLLVDSHKNFCSHNDSKNPSMHWPGYLVPRVVNSMIILGYASMENNMVNFKRPEIQEVEKVKTENLINLIGVIETKTE